MRGRLLLPTLVAALGAAVYLLVAPPSADLAAQEYRAELGLVIWNNGWYAGHHTPGYSILFPPLGAALGVRLTGAIAAVAAATLFAPLARRHWGDGRAARAAALWFAAGTTAVLLNGRITFLLGVAIGAGALLALAHERGPAALALAVLTSLASPVAGLFLALGAVAGAISGRARQVRVRGLAVAAAALAPTAVLLVLFPQGGSEPFVASAFWPALAGALLIAALLPAGERTLRTGALLYAVALVAAFVIATPLGGNASRLGALAAGPVLLGALGGRRSPVLLAALALPFAYWPLYPAVRDVVRASGDRSLQASYYAPLIEYLKTRPQAGGFRVEIPFTENHWEARHIAGGRGGFPLARGWERQLDRRYGALFYDGSLDAASYRAWLEDNAVAYVALPDVELDYAGADEARLVRRGLPYLRQVWHDAHWRVFAVSKPAPLASPATSATRRPLASPGATATLGPTTITIRATRPADIVLRVHHTRWWRVTAGHACVSAAPGNRTRVQVRRPGTIRIQARLTGASCRP